MENNYFKSNPYIIELLTPKQTVEDIDLALFEFQIKYKKIVNHNCVVSIPDNPLGRLHFTALEIFSFENLKIHPENMILHLNTFHRKIDLDNFLQEAHKLGIRYVLCVSGDGSPKLPRLKPEDLGVKSNTVTSVELLDYIKSKYREKFILGVAFNQYEPVEYELLKLKKKRDAGADFIITQPVIDNNLDSVLLQPFSMPVFPGAWMSKKSDLLYECVGLHPPENGVVYNPISNLELLHDHYPDTTMYLSLLPFKTEWRKYLPYYKSVIGSR